MNSRKALLEWYLESGVDETLTDIPMDHFKLFKDKKNKITKKQNVGEAFVSTITDNGVCTNNNTPLPVQNTLIEENASLNQEAIKQNYTVQSNSLSKKTPLEEKPKQQTGMMRNSYFGEIRNISFEEALKRLDNNNRIKNINKRSSEMTINSPAEAINEAKRIANSVKTIEELEEAVKSFEGCALKKGATNTVFSHGNRNSKIVIIGEAPGNNEDLQGIPFCGQSGQLLDNMLSLALGVNRDQIYITNVIFWRPPGNRRPTSDEMEICRPFVEKHLALLKPELIITMGATAMSVVIDTGKGITRSRRQIFDYTNEYLDETIKATPLFHPSYLLRQPMKKRDAWHDWLFIKDNFDVKKLAQEK